MLSWSQEMLPVRQHFGASRTVAVVLRYCGVTKVLPTPAYALSNELFSRRLLMEKFVQPTAVHIIFILKCTVFVGTEFTRFEYANRHHGP